MKLISATSILSALLICSASAQAQGQPTLDSARATVQRFYDWYMPRQAHPGERDMVMYAAVHGPLTFDTEMVRWLRIDSTARARAKDEIDGLDGDPYLNSQDPCQRYRAETATRHEKRVWVSVRGAGSCERRPLPDAIVVLEATPKGWVVRDFLNPDVHNQGLIALLKELHPKAK